MSVQLENDVDTKSTFQKFTNMKQAIANLRVRDKRSIFLLMRTAADQLTSDTFFPNYGFTAGEFAVGQVLSENNRNKGSTEIKTKCNNDMETKCQDDKDNAAEILKKKTSTASIPKTKNKTLPRSKKMDKK